MNKRNTNRRPAPTLIDVLNDVEGRAAVESIEDMLCSAGGAVRFAREIAALVVEIEALTGFRYEVA